MREQWLLVQLLVFCVLFLASGETQSAQTEQNGGDWCERDDVPTVHYGWVYFDEDAEKYSFFDGLNETAGVAWGFFNASLNSTGWGVLRIFTSKEYPDEIQSFAAGFLEGCLTVYEIMNTFDNLAADVWRDYQFDGPNNHHVWPDVLTLWMAKNEQYVRNITSHHEIVYSDPFYRHLYFSMQQFYGLENGYNTRVGQINDSSLHTLSEQDFWIMQSINDLPGILYEHSQYEIDSPASCDAQAHATAAIVLKEDRSDVYFAQNAWKSYPLMNRIMKFYSISLSDPDTRALTILSSSYAGILHSSDDFYETDFGMAVTLTPLCNFNVSLYDNFVTPFGLLFWQRVSPALRLADSGVYFSQIVQMYSTNTFSAEWFVVNSNLFNPGRDPDPYFLTILSSIPGDAFYFDGVPNMLERLWLLGFDVPAYKNHYDLLGYANLAEKFGIERFSYENHSRLAIFAKQMQHVGGFNDFMAVLRSNNYESDPESLRDPGLAIAGRLDLRNENVSVNGTQDVMLMGCIDAKGARLSDILELNVHAISGPPNSLTGMERSSSLRADFIPEFIFGDHPFEDVRPVGIPRAWGFGWVTEAGDLPASMCRTNLDCADCVQFDLCGWCDGSCVSGDSFGPFNPTMSCDNWAARSCNFAKNYEWLTLSLAIVLLIIVFLVLATTFMGILLCNGISFAIAHRRRKRLRSSARRESEELRKSVDEGGLINEALR